ncbi:MAG TPA: FkbM family methyltransferase, partial [Nitrospiraceae bacterium]|nr:FkbM family methyltransferase [Nitrospiraceae bacterium]
FVTFVSYAQNCEDVLIWRLLHDVERGQYLDIGAQDPVFDSVSLAFYNAGWRGLHVEPTPAYAARLREARPDETVIEAAITCSEGPIEFYEIPETGLSTGKADIAERHRESGFEKRTILVPCMRLDSLFKRMSGDVHWMKVDVEGMEAEVLKSWGEHPRRPWVLLIEATFPNTQEHCEHLWIEEVLERGYREAHFDGLSRYFIHENHDELRSRLEAPANLFDAFHVTSTHFSAGMLKENSIAELERVRRESEERESQLAQEIAGLGQALQDASAAAREAEAQRLALAETLAASESEYRHAIDLVWRERQEEEKRLRERSAEIERGLRDQISSANIQSRKDAVELAALQERAAQQELGIERLRAEAEIARKQVALLNNEISALRRSSREQREQAAAQINERKQQLGQANRVIINALAEPLGSWQRLGRALALFREDGARRLLRSWYANSSQPSASQVETNMLVPSGEARNPYLRANSLPELLAWNDLDFIRCAYVTILGRQPDPTGEAHYAIR